MRLMQLLNTNWQLIWTIQLYAGNYNTRTAKEIRKIIIKKKEPTTTIDK